MRSYTIKLITVFILVLTTTTAFSNFTDDEEYIKLIKLERKALLNGIGKTYIYDLTGRKDCNKTSIRYLGIVRTKRGKQYKILTSFFVFRAAATCHGTSKIKVFDMYNRFIGEYYVGMPESLPDLLKDNKLLYVRNSESCNLRKKRTINLSSGLPKTIFIPCTKTGGDIYSFSNGN